LILRGKGRGCFLKDNKINRNNNSVKWLRCMSHMMIYTANDIPLEVFAHKQGRTFRIYGR